MTLAELIGDERSLRSLKPADFADDRFGIPTVTDILAELEKPGRDPRPAFSTATFAAGVEKVADLKPGMVLEGVVTNVAAFGAFVDVGVHQDGLVHVSAMSDRYVSDPHEVVKSGPGGEGQGARGRRGPAADRADAAPQRHPAAARRRSQAAARVGHPGQQPRGDRPKSNRPKDSGRRESAPPSGSMAEALRNAGFGR